MSEPSWPSELPSEVISILSTSVLPGLKRLFETGMTSAITGLFQEPQGVAIATKLAAIKPDDALGERIAEGIPLTLCVLGAGWQDLSFKALPVPLRQTCSVGTAGEMPGTNANNWACFKKIVLNATETDQAKSLWRSLEKLRFFQAHDAVTLDETPWFKYLFSVSQILAEFKSADLTGHKAKKETLTRISATAQDLADLMAKSAPYFEKYSLMDASNTPEHPSPLSPQQKQAALLRRQINVSADIASSAPHYAVGQLDEYANNTNHLDPGAVACYKQLIDFRSLRPVDVVHAIVDWANKEALIAPPFEKPTVASRPFFIENVNKLHEELFDNEHSKALIGNAVGCLLMDPQMVLGATAITGYFKA